ncbi:hypothetical protein CIP107509_00108 [Corynebacterium diphtheriae]|nr:hypothetical protein CIP107509_00108 [Corynebacterium diphtheriae]CAB0924088.1 hypothetical protein FRC0433_00073 [Corynebacterium diphtheriae]
MDGVIRFLLENNHPVEGPVLGRKLLDDDSDVTPWGFIQSRAALL